MATETHVGILWRRLLPTLRTFKWIRQPVCVWTRSEGRECSATEQKPVASPVAEGRRSVTKESPNAAIANAADSFVKGIREKLVGRSPQENKYLHRLAAGHPLSSQRKISRWWTPPFTHSRYPFLRLRALVIGWEWTTVTPRVPMSFLLPVRARHQRKTCRLGLAPSPTCIYAAIAALPLLPHHTKA